MNSRTTPPGGDGSGPVRPRLPTPTAARPNATSGSANPPTRRFPAGTSYPPLSDKVRTPAARPPTVAPGLARAAPPAATPTQWADSASARVAGADRTAFAAGQLPPLTPRAQRIAAGMAAQPRPHPGGGALPPPEPPISTDTMAGTAGSLSPPGRQSVLTPSSRLIPEVIDPYQATAARQAEAAAPVADKRITPRSPRAALEPEYVPVPSRRRSKKARNPLVIAGNAVFTLLLLLIVVAGGIIVFGKLRFESPGPLQQEKIVNIPRAGVFEIADLLHKEGVIDEHRLIFIGGVYALKAQLKSGEYLFPKRASVRDVVETLAEGKVVQHLITIPEGLTSEQIAARLLDSAILTGSIKSTPREGSMLPNSYNFRRGDTREQAIQRMQQAQAQLVKEVWERRAKDLPLRTPEQLVILASIVEKETGRPEERTRVAAVFVNRLRQKMRLQTDPTVIYGLAPGKGTLGRPLSRADLEKPTPYNTYVIDALPPGPIANPGRASIEAAANPARTRELFFVSDGAGGHIFAETYEQHQKNVARLRVIEQGGTPEQAKTAQEAPVPKANPKGRRPKQKQ